MLNQVSSLVNMRNAKKLAQKGALQIESNSCSQQSQENTNLNEIDKLSTPSVLGGTMGSPIQQELPGGKTSTELPLATSIQTCCSVQSNSDQSNHQTRS